ncbi:HYR domain-containing protein [Draconibacterium orientale]|uniref:HYR-like domain-containing protein n=1 Tax=Draconibacterium orientale TaxID=1168034 RepID=UPI0029C0AD27|nr:HYR domain-containing protein [Draconibacterium orientale]
MAVLTFTMDVKSLCWESYAPDLNSELGEAEFLSKSVDAHSLFPANTLYDDTTSIICPEDIALYTDLNSCVAVINAGLNVTDPNSIISSLSWEMTGATEATSNGFGINQIGSYTFNEGTTVVTYRGATLYNNSINCTFTVTVTDNQAPRLISSPGHITVRNLPGECYANVSWTEPSAVDNCVPQNQLIYTSNYSSGQQFPVGSTRVEYRISDGVNTAFHSFTVTVIDAEAPEMIAPPAMESECGKPVPDAFTTWEQFEQAGGSANDNCSVHYGSFRYVGQTSSGITCPYTVTRIYSISDNDGNVSEVKHVIEVIGEGMAYEATVEATEPEVLLEPGAETQAEILFSKTDVSCKGSRTGVVDLTVNGTSGIVSFVWSTQNGSGIVQGAEDQSTLSDGDYTVMVYEDGVRLLAFDFSILVVDNQAPVLNAPATIQRKCGQYIPPAYSTWSDFANAGGTVSDNCQIYYSSFRLSSEVKSNPDCPYTLTRVYEITDVNGNRGVAEHLITVEAEEVILKSGMAGTFTAVQDGQWNDPATWGETVLVPTWEDDVIIPNGVKVTVDAAAVANNITIESGGELNHGVNLSTTVQVYGDWTNDGTYDGGTNGVVEFTGSGSASISGTTEFEGLIVNKNDGLSSALTIDGDVNVLSSGLLTMTSGLITIPGGSSFSVNPSIGLDIEYEAGFDVTGGSLATGDFTITNEGLIRIAAGSNVTLGDDSGNEVHTQFDGAFIVTGGDVDIAGRLYNSASGTLDPDGLNLTSGITISSGTVTLCTLGNKASSTGSLQVTSAGNFEFSGGTIVFQNPSTATSELDLGLIDGAGTKNITGGTFQFGNSNTPNGSIFHIDSEIKIPNIVTYSGSALFLDMPTDGASTVECINQATEPTPPVVQDNCGYEIAPIVPSGYVVTSYDGCEGDVTYTYTYEDCDGSSHDWVYTYTIDDDTDPTASNPAPVTVQCIGDVPAWDIAVVTDEADNCTASPVVAFEGETSSGTCPEIITRTYSVTDACGNSIEVTHTITVLDDTDPTASNPAPVTVQCIGDVPAWDIAVVTDEADNCTASPVVAFEGETSSGTCPEIITRTYSVTDACGNSIEVTHTITVLDDTDPTASNPAPVTVQCIGDVPAWDIAVVTDEADNCTASPVVAFEGETSSGTCPEIITRTYSVTDACGNSIEVTHTITVLDDTDPTASNPAPVTVQCIGDVPAWDIAVVTDEADNCTASPVVAFEGETSSGTCPEIITRTYSVTDACGNSIEVTHTITVLDDTDPTASNPAPVTVQCIGDVPAWDIAVVTDEADNCTASPVVAFEGETSSGTCPEIITRTYSVTDACGNSIEVTHTITVLDDTDPTASNPAPVTVQCIGDVPAWDIAVVTDEADNCTASPVVAFEGETSSGTCPEIITRTYSVTDACGNSIEVTHTITVLDDTDPTASNPAPVTVQCIGDVPAWDIAVVTDEADNCTASPVVAFEGETSSGTCPEIITRTYSVTDACGNSIEVTHTITVLDDTDPTASNPAPVTVQCIGDVPAWDIAVVTDEADNCTASPVVAFEGETSSGTCPEIITRTYSVTDACGNSIEVTHTITVLDDTDPTASNPAPVTVQCIGDVPAWDIAVVTDEADNCTASPVVAFVSDVSDGNSCPEVITRTYSVTDDCNNSIQVTQMITINDNILPTWTTTANNLDRTIECSDGSGLTAAQALAPVASDNCAGTISYTKNSGVFVPVAPGSTEGTYTNTWTAADACGNSTATVFTQVITIVDNTPPTITCPGNLTANTPLGVCGAVVTYTTPVGADNCAGATTVQTTGLPSGSTFPVGETINTFEVTDAAGNTNSCSFTVTVTDNRKPVLTLPATAIIACHESTHPDNTGWATATDNCAVDELSYTDSYGPPAVNCVNNYTIYRTWFANDIYGNEVTGIQEIRVSDVTGPDVVFNNQVIDVQCPDDIPVYYENLAEFIASAPSNGASDLCPGSVTLQLVDEYSVFDPATNSAGYCPESVVRIYRFYDECLNYTEIEQVINVDDLENCACSECVDKVNIHNVDLRSDPDSVWTLYNERRDKGTRCCLDDVWWEEGGKDPYRCVSFNVIIDDNAVGVQIETSKGQDVKEWRVDCENVSLEGPGKDIICLPSGEYHLFTHCKQGGDPIDYIIRSVRGIIESGDIETRVDCSREIHTTGDFESVPVWSALNPLYDKYLDTSDPYNPIFFVPLEDKDDVPSSIQYQVCADVNGYICGQAADGTICDTITVNVYDPIETLIDLGDVVMCAGTPIDVEPVISPAGNYTIEWFEGTGAIGTPIHTGYIHTIETPGWYSVKITEYESGLPCNESTSDFEVVLDLSKPGLSAPPDTLFLSCDDPNADQKIIDWRESAWAFIVDAYGDTVTIDVEDNYNTSGGINLVCNEVLDVEFKAVDPCSNDSIDIATIVVIDTTPPIITPASNSIADCNTLDHNTHEGYLAWLANHGGATASDNCQDPATLIWSDNVADVVWEGNGARDSITVTFTVTDDCDNSASTTATFIIVDDIPPVIECPPNVQDTAAENYCSKVPGNLQDPVYSDECSVPRLTWTSTGALVSAGDGTVAGIAFPVGVTVVTYTVTDDAGLTASCSFSVRIVDVTQPNIEIEGCQDVSETMGPDECYVIPTTINDPVYSDDCWPLSSLELSYTITGALNDAGTGSVRGKQFPVGVSTVEYTVTDPDGNSASCSFTVTMLRTDIPPAVISCPDSPEAVYATAGNCDAPVDLDSPTIDDPCATATYTISNDYNGTTNADDVYPVGITTVIWTITDNSGNETTCTQLVEVIDNQPPTITCQGDVEDLITVGGCDLESSLVTPPTYSDNCPNPVLTYVLTFEDGSTFNGTGSAHTYAFPVGKTQIHYTVTDAAGLKAECTYTVWIKNLDAPKFQVDCDAAIDVSVTSEADQCGANVSPVPPGIINPCNEVYSITNSFTGTSDASGFYPVGSTTVTWTIIDASGIEYTCEQLVEVIDNQPPVLTCQGDVEDLITDGGCDLESSLVTPPTYSDNCPNPVLTYVLTFEDGSTFNGTGSAHTYAFPVGKTQIHYTVTDAAGLKAECTYTVWIKNLDAPKFQVDCDVAIDVSVTSETDQCGANVSPVPPGIINPCNEVYSITNSFTGTADASGFYPVGSTTVTWTIIDASGTEYTCEQLVEVIDNQPPVLTCQGDVEDLITDGGCDLESSLVTPPTYSDNCPNPVLTYVLTFEDGSTVNGAGSAHTYAFPVGKTQIHYTVTDAAGLKAECTYTVWIKNLDAPQFQVDCDVAIDVSVTSDPDQCGANVSPVPPGIINPCNEVYSITNSFTGTADASGFYPVGSTTVTWTIIDASGTEYTCEQLVEVIDLPPFVNCPGDYEYQADFNLPYKENITVDDPTYGDNCPNPVLEWTLVEPDGTTYTSATTGINILPNPRRYYVGVTTISYKITDSSGLTDDCSFTVTVTGPPDITCPPTYQTVTDPGVCTATRSSDDYELPTLVEGVQPITWTWTIYNPDGSVGATNSASPFVGSASNPGPPAIPDFEFETGTSRVHWYVENISGFDECEHLVIVTDEEPPVITADPYENCVDPLHWATYNESDPTPYFGHVDPNLIKSPIDYRTLIAGDTDLDLTSLTDNCCDSLSMINNLQWRIEFADTPDPITGDAVSHPDITGQGQPSDYAIDGVPKDIYLWGDGVTFKTVTHSIFYWIEDCNGNPVTEELRKEITITPRPQVIKTDY